MRKHPPPPLALPTFPTMDPSTPAGEPRPICPCAPSVPGKCPISALERLLAWNIHERVSAAPNATARLRDVQRHLAGRDFSYSDVARVANHLTVRGALTLGTDGEGWVTLALPAEGGPNVGK